MVAQGTKMEVQMSIFGSRMELKWAGGRSFPSKENANGTLTLKSISFAWYNWCFLGGAITVSFTTPFTLQQLVPLQERMLIESSKLRNVSFARKTDDFWSSPSRENAYRIIRTQKCQFCLLKLMVFGVPLQERMLIELSKLRNVSFAI